MSERATTFTNEDGDLWGVFVYGHVPPTEAFKAIDAELLDDITVGHVRRLLDDNERMYQSWLAGQYATMDSAPPAAAEGQKK